MKQSKYLMSTTSTQKMKIKYLLLLSMLFGLTGCSTKTSLGYTPVIEAQAKNQICVTLEKFDDVRPKSQQIGALRNGLGMPIIRIVTEDNIPKWVENALEVELTNAGYSMVQGRGSYIIEGKIIKVFASSYFIYHGCLIAEITLKKGDEVLFKKTYKNNEHAGINWIAQASSCAEALKLNLQKMCTQFIADINTELLESTQ